MKELGIAGNGGAHSIPAGVCEDDVRSVEARDRLQKRLDHEARFNDSGTRGPGMSKTQQA